MMRERLPLYKVSLTSACFCFFLFSFTGIVRPSIRRLWKSSWAEWGELQSTVQKSQILERAGATAGGLRGHCQMLSSSASGRLQHPSTLQLSDQGLKKKRRNFYDLLRCLVFSFFIIYLQFIGEIEGDCAYGSQVPHVASHVLHCCIIPHRELHQSEQVLAGTCDTCLSSAGE